MELHAWKDKNLYDIINTATGAREQPLIFNITTAGLNRESICREIHDYTENVLNGVIEDDTFFGIIYTLDTGDDCFNSKCWIKSNPSLGASISVKELEERAQQAKNSNTDKNGFIRLRMNVWVSNTTGWIDYDKWKDQI